MKICYINPTVIIRRPISELANLFAKKGNKITIFTPTRLIKKEDKSHHINLLKHKNIKIKEYKTVNLPLTNFEWPIPFNPFLFLKIKKLFKKNDIVHSWTYFYPISLLTSWISKLKRKSKFITTLDTIPAQTFSLGKTWDNIFLKFNRTLGNWILRQSDKITVYSKSVRIRNAEIIPSGIRPHKIGETDNYFRNKFRNKKIITFIGLINSRKGINILIEIAKKTDAIFLVIGENPTSNQILENYKKISPPNMIYLGKRKDIHNILTQTDIFVFPSKGEGLPGVIFEAMLHGIPIIASNIPCIDEQIDNKLGGFLVNKDDPKEFINKIKEIFDKKLSEKMGEYNKEKIKEFYWKNLEEKYQKLYNVRDNRI